MIRTMAWLTLLLSGLIEASNFPELEALQQKLAVMVQEQRLPNSVVAMSLHGEEVFYQAQGRLDIDTQDSLPDNAIFRLYSMSKPITSVAIMQLAEQGKLSLQDPVSKFLPAFANTQVYQSGSLDNMQLVAQQRAMTIRDLLCHCSGITYHFTGDTPVHQYYRKNGVKRFTPVGSQPGDAPAAPDLATLIQRLADAPLLSQPGSQFDYSYSTTVLGRIIEVIADQDLESYLQQHILQPLAMHDTSFYVEGENLRRFVTNYALTDHGLNPIENEQNTDYKDRGRLLDGGGALAGSARDYLRFTSMLANGGALDGVQILTRRSVYRMLYPEVTINWGGGYLFGLGFAIGTASSHQAGFVPDGMYGWSGSGNTHFLIDPETQLAIVVMTQVLGPENKVGVKPLMVQQAALLRQRLLGNE